METGTVINGYRIVAKLGQGAFGAVYSVISEIDGKKYALKHSSSPNLIPDDWIREINISVLLKNIPHTTQLRYYFSIDCSDYYLVYDLERGDLNSYINAVPWMKRMKNLPNVYRQLINGAAAMNARGIYHSDIKPGNILYTNGRIKYNDFGLSLVSTCDGTQVLNILGSTPSYRSPEYRNHKISNKTDGYVVALVVLTYITRQRFPDYTVVDVRAKLRDVLSKPKFDYLMANYSNIVDELAALLEPDYTKRMHLKDSKFFNNKNYHITHIKGSGITLSKSQQRQFVINLKRIEQECDSRSYAIAYDCFVRYYRINNLVDEKIIYAICRLANAVAYAANRRVELVRNTPEGLSKSSILHQDLDYSSEARSTLELSETSSEPTVIDFPPEFPEFSNELPPEFPDEFSNELPPEFPDEFSNELPPEFPDEFSNELPPAFKARAKDVGPFILDLDEYRKKSPAAVYFYDDGHNYDYTSTNKQEIETELMVLYSLNGCISGCWQDPLHKIFKDLPSQEITILLVRHLTSGVDMFGNYRYLKDPQS